MKILEFPMSIQTYDYDCGAKALQAVLAYYGICVKENVVLRLAGTKEKCGTPISGIRRTAKKYGLGCSCGEMAISEIKELINKKTPVIILVQAWTGNKQVDWKKTWKDGHFVIVIGYDKNKIYFEDPFVFRRTFLTYKELKERWHGVIKGKKRHSFGIVISGKKPKFDLNKKRHMD